MAEMAAGAATPSSQAEPASPAETVPLPFGIGEKVIVVSSGPLATIAIAGLTPVLPQIAEALEPGANTLWTKQLVGIVGLAMAIGSPLAGLLISRTGPKRFTVVISLLYALAGTAGLYLSDLAVLMASRFLVGLSAAGFVIMAITMVNARLSGVQRAKWMGVQVSLAMVSGLAINPISGALGELSWRLPFAMFGLGIPMAMVAAVLLDNRKLPRAEGTNPSWTWASVSWFPWRFALLALAIGSITYLPVIYGPFLMRGLGATSPTFIGLILTADSLLGALMALAFGRSRKWLSANQTFAFSFAFTGLGAAVAGLAPSLSVAIAGMLIAGIGMGWLIPNLVTSLARHVEQGNQSKAAGITKGFHYSASPLCIFAVEPVVSRTGPAGALLIASALSATLSVICILRKPV